MSSGPSAINCCVTNADQQYACTTTSSDYMALELAANALGQKQLLVLAHAQLLQNHWRVTSPSAKIATKKQLAHAQQLH